MTIPAIIFYVEIPWLTQIPLAPGGFAAGVALLALHVLFYLALTLMLGTVFGDRGPIAGIGIGFLLAGMFFKGMLPEAFVVLTPWLLPDISSAVALGMPVPPGWFVSVIAAGCWIIVFMSGSIWPGVILHASHNLFEGVFNQLTVDRGYLETAWYAAPIGFE